MINGDSLSASPGGMDSEPRGADRRRCAARLVAAVSAGLAVVQEPRGARERLEEELRAALHARAVILRDEPALTVPPPNVAYFEVPWGHGESRARLEVVFDAPRLLDDWGCQLIEAAAQLAGMILELERASGRLMPGMARRAPDGAAPLIGSSEAIKRVRDRIERVAATDFTVLIEGGIGPQPHPGFVGLLG